MSSLFWMDEQKKLLLMLKQDAPSIFYIYLTKKRRELDRRIEEMTFQIQRLQMNEELNRKEIKELDDQKMRFTETLQLYDLVS